ncbi:MAG TPA: hypothetical protein VGU90_06125 [Terriglobales bacterium]|nr:hypothetical protein [Terriglobales bacterium]
MSHSAILVMIMFVLAPAFASAQVESSLYLLRIEHTSFESHVCVLLQKTGFFHLESDSGDSTRVFEGMLKADGLRRIQSDLQDPALEALSQEQIEEPLIRRSEFLALNISRGENGQQLVFRSAESQEPYRKSLQPIVRWLDDLHKVPHKELSEDAGKNNCLAPGKIALKKRTQEPPPQPVAPSTGPPTTAATDPGAAQSEPVSALLQLSSLGRKSHAAHQSCVLVMSNGFYRAEEQDQKQGNRKVDVKVTGGQFAPEETSQLQQLLNDPAISGIRHKKTSHAVLPISGEMLNLQIYRTSGLQDVVLSSTFNRRDIPFFYSGDGDISSAQSLLKFIGEHVWTTGSGRLDPSLRNDCQSAP